MLGKSNALRLLINTHELDHSGIIFDLQRIVTIQNQKWNMVVPSHKIRVIVRNSPRIVI